MSRMMKKVIAIVDNQKCFPLKCQHECMKYDPLNKREGKLVGFHLSETTGKAMIGSTIHVLDIRVGNDVGGSVSLQLSNTGCQIPVKPPVT